MRRTLTQRHQPAPRACWRIAWDDRTTQEETSLPILFSASLLHQKCVTGSPSILPSPATANPSLACVAVRGWPSSAAAQGKVALAKPGRCPQPNSTHASGLKH